MDSVCAAYSYAVLKNKVDPANEYVPVMLGPANSSTKRAFEALGLELPQFLRDVRPRVRDVQRYPSSSVAPGDPLYLLMDIFRRRKPSVVPVIDDGRYLGLLTADDINAFFLRENSGVMRQNYIISEENIERILEGECIKHGSGRLVEAPYMIGAMEYSVYISRLERLPVKPVLIVGGRRRHIQAAIDSQLPGIVITGVSDATKLGIDFSSYDGFVYLSYLDTAETLRLLRLSIPVSTIIPERNEAMDIDSDELFTEAKRRLQESDFRALAVFQDGVWTGYATRRCFLDKPRQPVILVDHNEPEQSVPGIEDADIKEILDHHRLAPPRMTTPIYIVSEPLGSTCSIVYEQFRKWGVDIDPTTARVLLSGLTSDTVMLKSPTTTKYDEHVARRLCAIGGIEDFNAFCENLFSGEASLAEQDPSTVIESDLKSYSESGVKFAIGQVEVMTLGDIKEVSGRYIKALEEIRNGRGLDWAMLLVSDVVRGNSVLLETSYPKESSLSYDKISDGVYDLPGVLSRKKQLLPAVLRALGE